MSPSPSDLAKRYWIDDIPGAATAGSRLNNLLKSLTKGQPITATSRAFLLSRGLDTLVHFFDGRLSVEHFNPRAQAERDQRIAAAQLHQQEIEAQKKAEQDLADAREAAMWTRLESERLKRESDPTFIARKKNQELRRKYGVDIFVEEHHCKRLMSILRKLDSGTRLPEVDTVWLRSEGRYYESQEILHAHHRLEADFCLAEYKRTNDPWQAVNASGHLRKCAAPLEACDLMAAIPEERIKQAKVKSAIRTTHGGAMRDLGRYTEALKLGEEAHALLPNSFMPCTLMGAINIELGHIDLGHDWYRMAEERGAKSDSIESELRSLLARMASERRDEAISELLRIDPARYGGLRRVQSRKKHGQG